MKKLIYTFFITLLLLGNQTLFSQNEESMVVISEENITILINKLRAYRNAKRLEAQSANLSSYDEIKTDSIKSSRYILNKSYESREIDFLNQQIIRLENELKQTKATNDSMYSFVKSQEIIRLENALNQTQTSSDTTYAYINNVNNRSLKNINKELEEIRVYMKELSKKPKTVQTVMASPRSKQKDYNKRKKEGEAKVEKNVVPIVTVKNDDTSYNKLQATLDSLRVEISITKTPITTKDSLLEPNQTNYDAAFIALQNQLEALRLKLDTKNSALTPYEILKEKFKDYKKSIFFGNNSVALNTESQGTVDELYTLLNENNNLDVVVKGFASNKGNPKYNENLSMQRTEAIKKALVLRGVHPTRVLTQYHGIDYNATDAASARRVETLFLIRR